VLAFDPLQEQRMLRGDLGGRAAGDAMTDALPLDHRHGEPAILEQPRRHHADDPAADHRDVDALIAAEGGMTGGRAGGFGPVGAIVGGSRHEAPPVVPPAR
jgi:hypothetical protein